MKLSATQKRAFEKLTDQWQSAYDLQESRNTLGSLVNLKLADVKHGYGAMFSPRTEIKYRLATGQAGRQPGRQAQGGICPV